MPATIAGIATALPPHRIGQSDAAEIARAFSCETAEQDRIFSAIFRAVGGRDAAQRGPRGVRTATWPPGNRSMARPTPRTGDRMQQYEEHAGPLAVGAAAAAARRGRDRAGRVTHLVTVSCSGFSAPGVDHRPDPPPRPPAGVARTHVGFMGCHGLLNGLRVARAFVEADAVGVRAALRRRAVQPALPVRLGRRADRRQRALRRRGRARSSSCRRQRSHPAAYHDRRDGLDLMPDCEDAMSWRIGDHGFTMTLSHAGARADRRARSALARRLAGPPRSDDRIGRLVGGASGGPSHPLGCSARPSGLDRSALSASRSPCWPSTATCRRRLSRSFSVRLQRARAPRPCVALAFGPGLAVEAALLGFRADRYERPRRQ